MKKKLFIYLLSIISVICFAVGLSACGDSTTNEKNTTSIADKLTATLPTIQAMTTAQAIKKIMAKKIMMTKAIPLP